MSRGSQLVSQTATIGDVEALGLGDGDVLAGDVDDEDGAGQDGHIAQADEVAVQTGELVAQAQGFLLGEEVELADLLGGVSSSIM